MKKLMSVILAAVMMLSIIAVVPVSAANIRSEASEVSTGNISFNTVKALYVHGVLNSSDTEAWQAWQSKHNENFNEIDSNVKYFFLPTSADSLKVDVYNAFSNAVTVNGVSIASGSTATVSYEVDKSYSVSADGKKYTLKFMKSNAEAGIYINNSNADGKGTDLMSYLNVDKSRSAGATGAIVDSNGKVDNTAIKKIKGRGNTTWGKPKKAYNITYTDNVKIAGMNKSKKYSILANYQDDSLSRNRVLYDLSDAVGMPYASDSRYVDFYVNGFYWGSYQMCEKIEVGKNNLVNDIDDEAYLNEDGTINEDFPFLCEIDASAVDGDDYYVNCSGGNKVTIKAPELEVGDPGYNEVKEYVAEKFNTLYQTARNTSNDISTIADIESIAKLYLINELGKNWDSGVSSTFLVWKQDENGTYKFYGSPVWDYDNSLGNAVGVEYDLRYMGVDDYEEYTGWWCKYKGKKASSKNSTNLMNCFARNSSVMAEVPQIWFNDFVPALKDFYGETDNGIMMSADEYYNLLIDSAEMNYTSGWLLDTGSWIADHQNLMNAYYDENTHKMVKSGNKHYNQNVSGMFEYMTDWMHGRSAWLSEQFYPDYIPPKFTLGDVNEDGKIDIDDVTLIQKYIAEMENLTDNQCLAADTTKDGAVTIDDVTTIQKYIANLIDEF
ncbi:MAG: CotH kinase family protein [Ruminococcus sp.]|nr:CotH kinase family protein [Ruminococcus sp.]